MVFSPICINLSFFRTFYAVFLGGKPRRLAGKLCRFARKPWIFRRNAPKSPIANYCRQKKVSRIGIDSMRAPKKFFKIFSKNNRKTLAKRKRRVYNITRECRCGGIGRRDGLKIRW